MARIVGFHVIMDGEDSGVTVWMARILGFQCGWRG